MPSAVVLLSSGLDSTVNLYQAVSKMTVSRVLTFDYGQRAAQREIEQSAKICKKLKLQHQVIEIKWLGDMTSTSLVNTRASVPTGEDVQIDDHGQSMSTAKAVWVPNRNGVFLNIGAAVAESVGADYVVPGFNIEEAATFPDNTGDFLNALDNSFTYSTANHVKTLCYTTNQNKTEIARLGQKLDVPFELIWPCYFGAEEICRECESCKRFIRATETS
ncbi:MAG: 7-cyano-7-deazaguanine synthase QueC [Bdellovibrionales bacterium]|nr:7-cyano-7-deazaguanine synthase QueC [Bdellovibrionales bacterium]